MVSLNVGLYDQSEHIFVYFQDMNLNLNEYSWKFSSKLLWFKSSSMKLPTTRLYSNTSSQFCRGKGHIFNLIYVLNYPGPILNWRPMGQVSNVSMDTGTAAQLCVHGTYSICFIRNCHHQMNYSYYVQYSLHLDPVISMESDLHKDCI